MIQHEEKAEDLTIAKRVEYALLELVRLKGIKDALDDHAAGVKLLGNQYFTMNEDYLKNKPLAWKLAREAIAGLDYVVPPAFADAIEAGATRPTFYLVQREGVYGRGIVGIFTTEAKAEEAARAAANAERDSHHEFACYIVQSNMRLTLAYQDSRGRDQVVFLLTKKYKGVVAGGHLYENVVERPA